MPEIYVPTPASFDRDFVRSELGYILFFCKFCMAYNTGHLCRQCGAAIPYATVADFQDTHATAYRQYEASHVEPMPVTPSQEERA